MVAGSVTLGAPGSLVGMETDPGDHVLRTADAPPMTFLVGGEVVEP
jgi:hypothetical protein